MNNANKDWKDPSGRSEIGHGDWGLLILVMILILSIYMSC